MSIQTINHFHLFCGLGGGAKGFNRGTARVGQATARYKCLGGVDSDPAGIADFEQLSGVKGTVLDMFDRDQYIAWHGCEPPEDSRCASVEEFLEKSQVMLLNQREATRPGGIYATLIGDMRKQGAFHSFQADFITMMPRHELKGVVIKMQHNMVSNQTMYANFKHPSIQHEYLLLWERSKQSLFQVIWDKAIEQKRAIASTWRSLIRLVMMEVGQASLQEIYSKVESIAGDMIAKNEHWKAKIRQQLQKYHTQVERGVWAA